MWLLFLDVLLWREVKGMRWSYGWLWWLFGEVEGCEGGLGMWIRGLFGFLWWIRGGGLRLLRSGSYDWRVGGLWRVRIKWRCLLDLSLDMELDVDGEEYEEEEEGLFGFIGGLENGIFNFVYIWRKIIVYFIVFSRNI